MLHIEKFTFNPFQENTYVIHNEEGECLIVDPGCFNQEEEAELTNYIANNKLKPKALINTHGHIDHVFGNRFVFDTYGLKPLIHRDDLIVLQSAEKVAEMYGLPFTPSPDPEILDQDYFDLGGERFKILFVPGHSPGHIALYSSDSSILISGDVLFKRSIGRTDLPGGDMSTLYNSVRNVLFKLPDDTVVYAGHMEETTIGEEKKLNPFFN